MDKRTSAIEDLTLFESPHSGEYCAKAGLLAFVRAGRVVLLNVETGAESTLPFAASEPRFSPDGGTLAMVREGQLWLHTLSTGDNRQITSMRNGVRGIQWSPVGDRLLFSMSSEAGEDPSALCRPAEQREVSADNAVAIDDFGYKFDGAGFVTLTQSHLWTVGPDGAPPIRLTDGVWDDIQPAWTPDGQTVVFISGRARPKKESIGADLFTVPATGGEIRRISTTGSIVCYPIPFRPLVTPDGKHVVAAYLPVDLSVEDSDRGMPLSRLLRVSIDGGEEADIFEDGGACGECVAFPYNASGARCYDRAQLSADGRCVYFLCGSEGRTDAYRAEVFGTPRVTLLSRGGSFTGLGRPQNGVMLASYTDETTPGEYYLLDETTGERIKRLTHGNAFLADCEVSVPEELWFDTLDGDGRVQGWVLPPQKMRPGRKYPAILYVHGGPHPYYTPCYDHELQCLAAAGFAVLLANPRGSSGYGAAHLDTRKAFDGSAYTDLLQFVAEAVRRFDFIDGSRVGATGGSYGGYMINQMATRANRFRCFVTQRSIASELISYASSDMQGSSAEYESFLDFMKAKLEKSAVCYAGNVRAPMLIMHGTDDLRCPVEGAHQFFVALKDTHRDLPVRLMLWPGTAHGQPQRPGQLIAYRKALTDWFLTHL